MLEVTDEVRDELERLAPAESARGDWGDVRRRHARLRSARHLSLRGGVALAAALAALVAVPSLALSADVRRALGLSDERPPVHPVFAEAQVLVEAPMEDGSVVRVVHMPTREGGMCEAVDVAGPGDRGGTEFADGSASCRIGEGPLHVDSVEHPITVGASIQPRTRDNARGWRPPVVHGWVSPKLNAARVTLEWNGGSRELPFANDHFVYSDESLYEPPSERFPYAVVAYDAEGREVARQPVPRGWLYVD